MLTPATLPHPRSLWPFIFYKPSLLRKAPSSSEKSLLDEEKISTGKWGGGAGIDKYKVLVKYTYFFRIGLISAKELGNFLKNFKKN